MPLDIYISGKAIKSYMNHEPGDLPNREITVPSEGRIGILCIGYAMPHKMLCIQRSNPKKVGAFCCPKWPFFYRRE